MSKKKSHTIIDTNYAVLQTQRFPIMAVGGDKKRRAGTSGLLFYDAAKASFL